MTGYGPEHPTPRALVVRTGLYLLFVLFALVSTARAQATDVEAAMSVYNAADFDGAIEAFSVVAADPEADVETRKLCFQYLGRAYVAKQMLDEARAAIRKLLELEDPMIELNPDAEPPPLMSLYYEVRTAMDGFRRDTTLQTMAVIDFTNGSIGEDAAKYDALGRGLASMMINTLGDATGLKVVERERLHWLLSELDLQQDANRVDQSSAVRAGKLLGAQSVLIGSFIMNGDQIYVGTRLVDVETSEILLGEQLFGKRDEIFDLLKRLASMTTEAIHLRLDEDRADAVDETRSLDAMMSYSEGLALLESEQYEGAYEKFAEALAYDPAYSRASLRIASLKPMLN